MFLESFPTNTNWTTHPQFVGLNHLRADEKGKEVKPTEPSAGRCNAAWREADAGRCSAAAGREYGARSFPRTKMNAFLWVSRLHHHCSRVVRGMMNEVDEPDIRSMHSAAWREADKPIIGFVLILQCARFDIICDNHRDGFNKIRSAEKCQSVVCNMWSIKCLRIYNVCGWGFSGGRVSWVIF